MTTEQSGAPSASAGGAAAPHPHAVDNAVAGALTDQYGFLPLSVRYAAAEVARGIVERWQNEGVLDDTTALPTGALATQLHAIVEEWQKLVDAHPRLADLVQESAAGPDPRDAEIERLRAQVDELAKIRVALFGEVRQALTERDEAREEWQRADAEVTRLKRLVGNETVSYDGWDQLSRHDAIVRCEEGWQEYLKARDERDRLRQELDLIGAQQPKFQPGQRVRIGLCDGIVITPKDTTRVQFEGMLHTFDIPTRDVHAIDDIVPAEPRRWVAGDHEPAVGTEVTFGAGVSIWKRHSDDTWKSNSCQCKQCKSTTGLTWQDLIAYAPLVEVVTPDGD